jgi:uncharacterized protein YdhG (YjbR/CyaY superfamily)
VATKKKSPPARKPASTTARTSARKPERSAHFPAIEKKHGKPVAHWLKLLAPLRGRPYTEQMALLQSRHRFSRNHANAVVMYFRGSTSSRRVSTLAEFIAQCPGERGATIKKIFAVACTSHPDAHVVIAWNQPMLKVGDQYIFGVSATKEYLLFGIWNHDVHKQLADRFTGLVQLKKTVRLPADWKVDTKLLHDIVKLSVGARR